MILFSYSVYENIPYQGRIKLNNLLNSKGQIFEIAGLPKSSPACERSQGFHDAIAQFGNLIIYKQIIGNWLEDDATAALNKLNSKKMQIDLVYAHNDVMGFAAYKYFDTGNVTIPKIIGIDGLSGDNNGMDWVSKNILSATILYPTGGSQAIRIAFSIG